MGELMFALINVVLGLILLCLFCSNGEDEP